MNTQDDEDGSPRGKAELMDKLKNNAL
jgi:hypothetical protein